LELDPLSVQLDGANLEVNAAPADAPPTGSDDEGMSTGRLIDNPVCSAGRTHPMVVMKVGVNESSENRRSRQLLPTPVRRVQVERQ